MIQNIVEHASRDREAWLARRKLSIGASEVACIVGESPWGSSWSVWANKTDRAEPWGGSRATTFGTRLEPMLIDHAEEEYGDVYRDVMIGHTDVPLSATLDAMTKAEQRPIEVKTSGVEGPIFGEWGEDGSADLPIYYDLQLRSQMACVDADVGYLIAYLGGEGIRNYVLERDQEIEGYILETVEKWWEEHIVKDKEPDPKGTKLVDAKRLRIRPSTTTTFDFVDAAMVTAWDAKKKAAAAMKKEADEMQGRIIIAMKGHEGAALPDGRTISNKETTRKGYTVAEATFRTLRVKKAPKPKKAKA